MRLLYPSPYRELSARGPVAVRRVRYGPAPDQWGELRLPASASEPVPVVVLVHGGFWRRAWRADLMNALAVRLTGHGLATWNVEYRRSGMRGGGYPGTLDDAAAAADALAAVAATAPVDARRWVAAGHSAGGQLALVAARRAAVRPRGAVVLAGVCDLVAAAAAGLGDGAAQALMGGAPEDLPAAYRDASPIEHLPLGVPQLLVHGTRDHAVPVSMSSLHARRAQAAGDEVDLAILPGTGHAELIDPQTPVWSERILPWIDARLR